MKPLLIDCTLRDRAYIVDSMFGDSVFRGIINQMEKAGAKIIECGWLKKKAHQPGSIFYHVPTDLEQYLSTKEKNSDLHGDDRLVPLRSFLLLLEKSLSFKQIDTM